MSSRNWLAGYLVSLLVAVMPLGVAAATQSIGYYTAFGDAQWGGYLIEWTGSTQARVVHYAGASTGSVNNDGAGVRTIALAQPLVLASGGVDACEQPVNQRIDVTSLIVRDVAGPPARGSSRIVQLGTVTNLDGCQPGLTQPWGSPDDPGEPLTRVALAAAPDHADLTPGVQLAGLSEDGWPNGDFTPAVDLATVMGDGSLLFASTGHVVPASWTAGGWWVLALGGSERGYVRLAVDPLTGAENWLMAEWASGRPQRVLDQLVVKVASNAGFGGTLQAARMWQSGLFASTPQPFWVYLYANGSGDRVSLDTATGTETRSPIVWNFLGNSIEQHRYAGTTRYDRVWVPVRNAGARVRFVIESETMTTILGTTSPFIKPRMNFYTDDGRATPSPSASGHRTLPRLTEATASGPSR